MTLAVVAGAVLAAAASAQPFVFESLIAVGDEAPGGAGGTISFLSTGFDLNETGLVAWEASMTGTAGGAFDNRMIGTSRLSDGADFSVARGGTSEASGGYRFFAGPRLNDLGQVLVEATTRTGSVSTARIVRFNADGSATTIVSNGDALQVLGPGGLLDYSYRAFGPEGQSLASYDLDNAGNALIRASLGRPAPSGGVLIDDALVYHREGSNAAPALVALEGVDIATTEGAFATYSTTRGIEAYGEGTFGLVSAFSTLPASGRAALSATYNEGSDAFDFSNRRGAGETLPNGRFITGVFGTNWLSDGTALVNIETDVNLNDAFGTDAYGIYDASGITPFLSIGDAAPDGGAFSFLGSEVAANDQGLFVFQGRSDAPGDQNAIYAMNILTGDIARILSLGDAIFAGTLSSISQLALDDQNRLVFSGAYRPAAGPSVTFIATTDLSPLIPAPGPMAALAVAGVLAGRRRR